MGALESKIEAAVSKYGINKMYSGAIIGFSGGADSSALLHFMKDRCKCLLAVHVNHMIRGKEAERDEQFCRSICEKYGVSLKVVKIDVPSLAKEKKQGLEETAREARYALFEEIIKQSPEYKCILTAHNANDNAETVLFNMARGSGLNGICGIKATNDSIVRPMIYATRAEIIDYCNEHGIEYVHDSTNDDTAYTRNHIRHNVISELEKINPSLISAITHLCEGLKEDEEFISDACDKLILENSIKDKISLELFNLQPQSIKKRLLMKLSPEALDYKAISACIELAKRQETGKKINLSNNVSFKIERGYINFVKTNELLPLEFHSELKKGANEIKELGIVLCVDSVLENEVPLVQLCIDPLKINGRLSVRSKRDGDTIRHGKMTKKLKRVFSDLHIPSHKRDKLPIICDEDGVLCVPEIIARDGVLLKKDGIIINIYKLQCDNGGRNG